MEAATDSRRRSIGRRRWLAGWCAPALALLAAAAGAQSITRITPTLSGEVTVTNNVDLLPSDQRKGDVVFTIRPGVAVDYENSRGFLRGSVGLPILLYARTGSTNNEVNPQVDLQGRAELVRDFFFVEASASVQQTFFDPFGAQPPDLSSATDNRITTQTYRVSPYITGRIGPLVSYFLRNDNTWTNLDDSPIGSDRSYTNRLWGSIDRTPTPFGWGADIDRTEYDFKNQPENQVLELARVRAVWRPDALWQTYVSAGYERNRFPLSESEGVIYGLGVSWRPSDRTLLDFGWEQRFFGPSYRLSFDHRTPRTVWSVRGLRNITSYPEQLASLPSGSIVPLLLNQLLLARIPDPVERTRFIADYMGNRGLPLVLTDPINIYTQQIVLQESISATVGALGARNSVFVSAYHTRNEPIAGSGSELPPAVSALNNNTQVGGNVVWSYQITSNSSLTASGEYLTTSANPPFSGETDQWALRLTLTRPLSARTTAYAGLRYVTLDSDVQNSYREAAIFAGVGHTFR